MRVVHGPGAEGATRHWPRPSFHRRFCAAPSRHVRAPIAKVLAGEARERHGKDLACFCPLDPSRLAAIVRDVARVELKPREIIVPVLGRESPDAKVQQFGTGSIIGDGSILLTANHVVDRPGQLFITTIPEPLFEVELDAEAPDGLLTIEVAQRDKDHDLALLKINDYRPSNPLIPWFDFPLHENLPASTYEYSTTREERGRIRLSPVARQGHITRRLTVDRLGPAGEKALEVSFPAVRGASGAPLIYEYRGGFHLIGVLVSNAEYHLLPAHVQLSLDTANTLADEVRYFLPQGIAVNICHLRSMYDRVVDTPGG